MPDSDIGQMKKELKLFSIGQFRVGERSLKIGLEASLIQAGMGFLHPSLSASPVASLIKSNSGIMHEKRLVRFQLYLFTFCSVY